ncbi:MAG TPA: hypothetical protein VIK72_09810 [Clostridiaceae bacterium]
MNKKSAIILLFGLDLLILIAGGYLTISCYINNISYKILNTSFPGFILGLVVIFLGARYFKAALKMSKNIFKNDLSFSWGNFKREKKSSKVGKA